MDDPGGGVWEAGQQAGADVLQAEVDNRHQVGRDRHCQAVNTDHDDSVEMSEQDDDGDRKHTSNELAGAEAEYIAEELAGSGVHRVKMAAIAAAAGQTEAQAPRTLERTTDWRGM